MAKQRKCRLPRGLFERDGFIHIRYADRTGKILRESTEQTSVALAQDILRKRKIEVREGKEFPATRFAHVRFSELTRHGGRPFQQPAHTGRSASAHEPDSSI